MAPADLLPFLLLGLGLTAPVAALGHGFDDMQAARRAVGRIRDVLAVPSLPEPAHPVAPQGHRVELRDVRFGYDADHEVLRGIDLVLEPGTVTAIVGPSGSGKSTLVQLLPRFFDPTHGSVALGGVDLRELGSRELYRLVSFVFQDVRLLRASVADNIALAVPHADLDDVVRAARLANIHDRILELPRGYDTVLGEEATLSGGEAQRISIARALLADAPVLVLDEATAFADPQTEQAVRRALATLAGDRTILVIAHRLETVADADTVVVLENGSIVERGSPAELLAQNGKFAEFWRSHRGDEPSMIRMLLRVLGHEYARPVRRTVALMTTTAVAEGLSYALLVPVLRALFGSTPGDAWPWLIAFGAAVAVYAVLRYLSDLSGFRAGTTLLRGMYHRLGDHLARLPIGWYSAGRVGEVSVLASRGVLEAMSVIAHLLAPFISACVTPLTIVVVMLAFNWQLGLAALVAVPVVAAIQVWTGRSMAATDAERAERDHEATGRVIEYLQAQPVLRAGGRTAERFGLLDDSLREVQRASRRSTLSALPGVVGLTLAVQAMFTVLLVLGAYLALGGNIGAAEVLAILVLAARCADPLLSLADIGGKLRGARAELAQARHGAAHRAAAGTARTGPAGAP